MTRPIAIVSLLAIHFLLVSSAAAGRDRLLPYRLAVDVSFAQDVGSESVRRDLERQMIRELDDRNCFEAVSIFDADGEAEGDLLLRLIVDGVERETTYDLSIAQRSAPDRDPDAEQQYVTSVEARIRIELLTLPDLVHVRSKRFTVVGRHRPEGGEDARTVARFEMIDEVTETTRNWVCKDSSKKLSRQIESALAEAESVATPR